jgi:hypothetical protein
MGIVMNKFLGAMRATKIGIIILVIVTYNVIIPETIWEHISGTFTILGIFSTTILAPEAVNHILYLGFVRLSKILKLATAEIASENKLYFIDLVPLLKLGIITLMFIYGIIVGILGLVYLHPYIILTIILIAGILGLTGRKHIGTRVKTYGLVLSQRIINLYRAIAERITPETDDEMVGSVLIDFNDTTIEIHYRVFKSPTPGPYSSYHWRIELHDSPYGNGSMLLEGYFRTKKDAIRNATASINRVFEEEYS